MRLYYAYFKKIPSIIRLDGVHSKKIKEWIDSECKKDIVICHQRRQQDEFSRKLGNVNNIFYMRDQIFIDLEFGTVCILYTPEREALAETWMEKLRKFTIRKKVKLTSEISLIRQTKIGLGTKALLLKKPKLDLNKNYNDDLMLMHQKTVKSLREKNKSGLILFHGAPGTGKSTYIRYLVHHLKKKVIFMPPRIAASMDSPEFTDFLMDNANTVFVIEEAEHLITSRENGYNSGISMLLNLTDGLLGESLGIQIIATFNTNIANIDKALLRKGRLIGIYEFKPLCIEKSKILLVENGMLDPEIKQPMTLADIYNIKENDCIYTKNKRPSIGFLSKNN
jgi:hypothetical protein